MKNQDMKDFKAHPDTDWELVSLVLVFLFIVIALAVEWPKEGRELEVQMHPVTHTVTDCAEVPMIELDMPIYMPIQGVRT